jgi:uncharacterized membrane protein HdeD (DUF308 family)/3',5'-cyclic AMP phosphodiesterase CpdA
MGAGMTPGEQGDESLSRRNEVRSALKRNWIGILTAVLSLLALLTPLVAEEVQGRVGLLLIVTALLEISHGFRRRTASRQRAAIGSGAITLAMGLLLVNSPLLATTALLLFWAGWFAIDGVRHLLRSLRAKETGVGRRVELLSGAGNLVMCVVLFLMRGQAAAWVVALLGALRIAGTAFNIFVESVFTAEESGDTVVRDLGLPDLPEVHALAKSIAEEESARVAIDRGWIIGFVLTLFSIHIARMGFDRTALGIVAPGFAVAGDLMVALLLAYIVVIPTGLLSRTATWRLERRGWNWCAALPPERRRWGARAVFWVLKRRLRSAIRLRQARYSLRTALSRGLQIGLPLAAVIAATVPVWGISWYFDTENWAAGLWNSWAEARTDTWREAMVEAVRKRESESRPDRLFAVEPPGVAGDADFAFIVIGDTGEGDASQHSLRAEYLRVVRDDDVKFVVISSDVVYPTGAMRDYEDNFWLPFMGTTKPVYAIPGNHDWYDALEGFAATFLEPDAARSVMRARIEVDNRITSTTDARIEELVAAAARLQSEYQIPTRQQKAPFFQIQTDSFALFAVDTGVIKGVDPTQFAWLDEALTAASGKVKMAILGHPLYAGGHYQASANSEFAALHALLRKHDVQVVMAGDTHDLEYYAEPSNGPEKVVHHFVNGGGGAYLSFGTALAWPEKPATVEWAFYPDTAAVSAKIEATTPTWKRPAWWWTKQFGAWPFSAEGLAAAFDVNAAPYYQSFMEIRVEPSRRRMRLIPHGVHGRLKWGDLERPQDSAAGTGSADELVEWSVPLR